jgi:hypothetical protein
MVNAKEKLKIIEYDLAFMKKWLPRNVEEGKIGKDFAQHKLDVYEAIKKDYERLADAYEGEKN